MNNNYQEALDILRNIEQSHNYKKIGSSLAPESDTLQELVDKETPKKVYKGDYSNIDPLQFGWCHCPNCKKGLIPISYKKAIKLANYCLHCGQKLDWSKENETL